MDSFTTARAMIDYYIAIGAAKVEQERQWREVAAEIQGSGRCGRFPAAVIWRHCQPRSAR